MFAETQEALKMDLPDLAVLIRTIAMETQSKLQVVTMAIKIRNR